MEFTGKIVSKSAPFLIADCRGHHRLLCNCISVLFQCGCRVKEFYVRQSSENREVQHAFKVLLHAKVGDYLKVTYDENYFEKPDVIEGAGFEIERVLFTTKTRQELLYLLK